MSKERKRFTTFDADCYNAVYNETEMALSNIIRIYDYQKDIPQGKILAERTKKYTEDNEHSENLLLVELGSCVEFSKRLFFNFLEAKEMYKESGRRGSYLEYCLKNSCNKMLDWMIDEQYENMENLFFEKDDKIVDITKNIFRRLDKLTEGETVEDNEKNYEKKYVVLKEVLDSMGSPYFEEIVAAEKEIMKNYKENK